MLFLVAVFACNEGQVDRAEKPEKPSTESPNNAAAVSEVAAPAKKAPETKVSPPNARPIITLLSAGSLPRRVLRVAVKPGKQSTLRMSTNIAMEIVQNGRSMPRSKLPAMTMVMAMKVTEVDKDGNTHYEFELLSTEVDSKGAAPGAAEAIRAMLTEVHGMTGSGVTTSRGVNVENKINVPPTADTKTKQTLLSLQQALSQISAPLPESEVGVGGQWKVANQLSQNGVILQQETQYTLKAMADNVLTLSVRVTQSARQQSFAQPGAPAGMTFELVSLDTKGTGEMQIDLSNIVPIKASTSITSKMEIGGSGGKMAVSTHMNIAMTGK